MEEKLIITDKPWVEENKAKWFDSDAWVESVPLGTYDPMKEWYPKHKVTVQTELTPEENKEKANKLIGERIAKRRKKFGWSRRVLAEKLNSRFGTTEQQIAQWESGKTAIKAHMILPLARCLNCSTAYLLGEIKNDPWRIPAIERMNGKNNE